MKKFFFGIALGIFGWLSCVSTAQAFDIIDERISHSDNKFITISSGLGFMGFHLSESVGSSTGFAFQIGLGHHFNEYVQGEIAYKLSLMTLNSPDPVSPGQRLNTGAAMNQEFIRLIFSYPAVMLQPYVSFGVGGYNFFGVNRSTALDFGSDWMIPLSAGIRAFVYENRISFDAEFNYQILFGEDQSQSTLNLLGVNEVAFNTYSTMFSFTFHLW